MKFDEIKDLWKREEIDKSCLNESIEKIKEATSPILKIKKNMRWEFIATWFFLLLFAVIFSQNIFFNFFSRFYLCMTFLLILVPTIYFHIKFYSFYNQYLVQGISTYSALLRFSKKMTEMIGEYRTYNYISVVVVSNFLYRIAEFSNRMKIVINNRREENLEYFLFMLIVFAIVFVITEIALYYNYKIHLNKIDELIISLESDEEDMEK